MSTHTTPIVTSFQACGAFDVDHECPVASCVRCGWSADEHDATQNHGARPEVDDRRYAHAA